MSRTENSNRRRVHLLGLALVAAAWASAGARPLTEALNGVRAPIDFVRSFVAARALAGGERLYAVGTAQRNAEAAQLGAPTVPDHEGPYLPHPPPAVMLVVPLVLLSFAAASVVWLLVSIACAGWLARLLSRLGGVASPAASAGLLVLMLLWPPFLHNAEKGQWSILLAALMAAGWRDLSAGAPRRARAGVWLGLAASLKVMPVLLFPLLAMRARPAARSLLLTLAGVAAATLPVAGLTGWLVFVETSGDNVRALETWPANTASLHGLFARLFAGGPFARPLLAAPALARALTVASGVSLLIGAAMVTRRSRRSDDADDALFALWTTLVVLLNPLGWAHSVFLLLLPWALLAKMWHEREATAAGTAPSTALWIALALLSIPKETLYRWAGALPVSPAAGMLLSVHAAGALIIFAVAVYSARAVTYHRLSSEDTMSRERSPEHR